MNTAATREEAEQLIARAKQDGWPYDVVIVDESAKENSGSTERIRELLAGNGQSRAEIIGTSKIPLGSDQVGVNSNSPFRLIKPLRRKSLYECLLTALHRTQLPEDASVVPEQPINVKWHILLAEDNLVNQKLAIGFLEKMGHQVDLAVDGLHALRMSQEKNYDAILMDLQMPLMGGLEAAVKIRELEKAAGRHAPIIAMTAHATLEDRQQCLDSGMDGYITKPVRKEILKHEMERVLMNSKPTPETPHGQELTAETSWNLPELLERLDNDRAFLAELLTIFCQDSRVAMKQAQDALSKPDLSSLERKAHTLKGMLRNLLMGHAAKLASDLESAARQGRAQDCALLFAQLQNSIEKLAPEIDAQMQEVRT